MKIFRIAAFLLIVAASASAQMTTEQRISDFRQMANLYANRYAQYDWKRELLGYDARDIGSWLERIKNAKDDLEFYDICVEYVSSLNDAHDRYYVPSTFVARLGFSVDIYDGKVLIDSIDRKALPQKLFPFQIGDELVSVDGQTAEELIAAFSKYAIAANTRSTRREAASRITVRSQQVMPRAVELGNTADVVVQRADGWSDRYTIPWQKSGQALKTLEPRPSPYPGLTSLKSAAARPKSAQPQQDYKRLLQDLRRYALPHTPAVLGMGVVAPVFSLPSNFAARLGLESWDTIYSGTYSSNGQRVGFIRIPDFESVSSAEFQAEITYMQSATDGLVIDITRNPGGSVCLAEDLLSRVIPQPFHIMLEEVRVTWSDLLDAQYYAERAQAYGSAEDIAYYDALVKAYDFAYHKNNGRTMPIPMCGTNGTAMPATDRSGNVVAYTKPILVLTDEMSASCGDIFAAVMQDNKRGPLFGMRTMGAGGAVTSFNTGVYSEGQVSLTWAQGRRWDPVANPGYPTTIYVENVGVHPDVNYDYMTRENLLSKGAGFVQAFSAKIVELIQAAK